ncbi:type II toxin-antitoxin system PemK/MazF family toxin [Gordonia zhaorongruii]|uniref:type II toxin-antitoxin system PemK/MazF family toxin n=1 Tax=Gordonia zhaorongruii TaxID=2597659 RepID=UPI0010467ADD|nr:type II toxin-antitoxin system PemK/MazF family toxin [Gordonia zhaorongruii]
MSGAPGHPSGDYARRIVYAPDLDGAADPGEIVWTWVPFEEDATQGKDRPVLVVGREGDRHLLGLMLSSKDYHRGDVDWRSIGSGSWDRENRESFVRLDRVLRVEAHGIRREGAICSRESFDAVAADLRERFGWS